ncbi:MAG: hypothetical protein L0241_09340 [Planctomycetia bacterium]|nr:hypothetical protein [Planctomycetia bacterium]
MPNGDKDDIYDRYIKRPEKRAEPFKVGFIMKATFDDPTQHAASRFLLTYIYVLLLRKTARLLGGGDAFLVHASVQARTGNGKKGTEGSHQLLREVSFGGTYVYDLKDIPQGLKGALVYCAAQVTITPGLYNRTDQLLEEPEITLREYLNVVRETIQEEADTPKMRDVLFGRIVRLFRSALVMGKAYAGLVGLGTDKGKGVANLPAYQQALTRFEADRSYIVAKSTEDWMYAMRIGGGWDAKNKKSWESIRAKLYKSD